MWSQKALRGQPGEQRMHFKHTHSQKRWPEYIRDLQISHVVKCLGMQDATMYKQPFGFIRSRLALFTIGVTLIMLEDALPANVHRVLTALMFSYFMCTARSDLTFAEWQ